MIRFISAVFLLVFTCRLAQAESLSTLEEVESQYGKISVVQVGPRRYMMFGNPERGYIESAMDVNSPEELIVEYTKFMSVGTAYSSDLGHAVMIGTGGGRTLSYLSRTFPRMRFDAVEIDCEVIRVAKEYFLFDTIERVESHCIDGRIFLSKTDSNYDIVLLDAYRGDTAPFHLMTEEFLRVVRSRLAPGGVLVQNIDPTTILLDSAVVTAREVFDQVDTFRAGRNVVIVAYSGSRVPDTVLARRATELDKRFSTAYPLESLIETRFVLRLTDSAISLTDDYAPVEKLGATPRVRP